MKDWVTLARVSSNPQAGEYAPAYKRYSHGTEIWCSWGCPTCQTILSIGKNYHTVNYLGEVYPMVACPRSCGFSNWVKLEDWVPEAQGQA